MTQKIVDFVNFIYEHTPYYGEMITLLRNLHEEKIGKFDNKFIGWGWLFDKYLSYIFEYDFNNNELRKSFIRAKDILLVFENRSKYSNIFTPNREEEEIMCFICSQYKNNEDAEKCTNRYSLTLQSCYYKCIDILKYLFDETSKRHLYISIDFAIIGARNRDWRIRWASLALLRKVENPKNYIQFAKKILEEEKREEVRDYIKEFFLNEKPKHEWLWWVKHRRKSIWWE